MTGRGGFYRLTLFSIIIPAFLVSGRASEGHGKVHELRPKEFDSYLERNDFVLINYCVPDIGRCKALGPELALAAKELVSYDVKIQFAHMNVEKYSDFAENANIVSHPTLKWYEKGKFVADYDGGRTKDRIVEWVVKQTKPNYVSISTPGDLATFKIMYSVSALGYFPLKSSSAADKEEQRLAIAVFDRAARDLEPVPFGLVQPSVAPLLLGTRSESTQVFVYRRDFKEENQTFFNMSKGYLDQGLEARAKIMVNWVLGNRLPLVVPYSQDTAIQLYEAGNKFRLFMLCDRARDVGIMQAFAAAAKLEIGKVTFVTLGPTNDRMLEYLNSTAADYPSAHLVTMVDHANYYFRLRDVDFENAGVYTDFIQKAYAGEIKPHVF